MFLLPADFSGFPWHCCAPYQKSQKLFRRVDLSTSPGCGCRRPSPCEGPVGIEPTLIWGSLSLPSRFKPDLGLFRTFGVDLSTSPGCGCSHTSPCVGPVGIAPTLTRCKSSGLTARPAGPCESKHKSGTYIFLVQRIWLDRCEVDRQNHV